MEDVEKNPPNDPRFRVHTDEERQIYIYDAVSHVNHYKANVSHNGTSVSRMTIDASRVSGVYSNDATSVMPRSIAVYKIIKY